jgi:hypothetical protein
MRSKNPLLLALCAVSLLLDACTTMLENMKPAPPPPPPKPVKVTAVGHGTVSTSQYNQYNTAQLKMMAMRAAKLDAYRNLAEQVYGFRLSGASTISAFASQRDYVRVQVDAYVRGARVLEVKPLPDGSYEARVEAELPADIHTCLIRGDCPQAPKPSAECIDGSCTPAISAPACTGIGCAPASGSSLGWGSTP